MKLLNIIRSLPKQTLDEGPKVFLYKIWKIGRVHFMRSTGRWAAIERRVHAFWADGEVDQWRNAARNGQMLITKNHSNAFLAWIKSKSDWETRIKANAEKIIRGDIAIFGSDYHFDWPELPWHADWRYGYIWKQKFFRGYDFYEYDKPSPYDVKYPWELSRFSFLLPLAQTAVITGDPKWQEQIARVVGHWEDNNKLSFSVNWCAMECAMRGISLSLVAQIIAMQQTTTNEHLKPLLRQMALQGEFLSRNIEFTRTRNNHYTANIVALLLIGHSLQRIYPGSEQWLNYGAKRIIKEIELQYCDDGVNFEKSTSYHRLVTELFLLSILVMQKTGFEIPKTAMSKIHKACEYTRYYTRPDGVVPNFGDNDSAWLLAFDPYSLRDHQTLSVLASAVFSDPSLKAGHHHSSSECWLTGGIGAFGRVEKDRLKSPSVGSRLFKEGGMLVSRFRGNCLIADYGEVGANGTGGHGHNDTFSFELCLEGNPVIIDPGSPVYTGDLNLYNKYRSTAFHNTAMVDNKEMARLVGTWLISAEATPRNIRTSLHDEIDEISGEHSGYARLHDPVLHERTLKFFKYEGRLECKDRFICSGYHSSKRLLHFAPGLHVIVNGNSARVCLPSGGIVEIVFEPHSKARLVTAQVSEYYGHLVDSLKLELDNDIHGETELRFQIVLIKNGDS